MCGAQMDGVIGRFVRTITVRLCRDGNHLTRAARLHGGREFAVPGGGHDENTGEHL